MERNYYTIKITNNNEAKEQMVGLDYSLEAEGIEYFDFVERLGIFDCTFTAETLVGKDIEFEFGCGDYINIKTKDFIKMLHELDLCLTEIDVDLFKVERKD